MGKFNSEASEFGLILLDDEYILTSNRKSKIIYQNKELHSWTGEPFYKLLAINDEENAKFKNIEDLNSDYHNGPGVFDENYQMFYFTRTKSVKTRQKPSHIDPTSWYNPPSKDLNTNRLEIYMAEYINGKWSEPKAFQYNNANEYSVGHPAISKNGKVLYFSSDMPDGMGGSDIYFCVRNEDGTWTKPQNALPLKYVDVEIKSGNGKVQYNAQTDENSILYYLADCDGKYNFKAQLDGYFAQNASTQTHCETHSDTIYVDMVFERIIINKPIVLKNIYYDFDKWNIRADAAIELDKLVQIMVDNPQIIVELGSHTDSRGSFKYNQTLSQRRAESAVEYIIANGIDADRITAKGYGESVLVNNCSDRVNCSEEEHQLNRRTEFKVIGYKLGSASYQK